MHVVNEQNTGEGTKIVKFATTPLMSTYLVAFAVGDFTSIHVILKLFTLISFSNDVSHYRQRQRRELTLEFMPLTFQEGYISTFYNLTFTLADHIPKYGIKMRLFCFAVCYATPFQKCEYITLCTK